MTFIPRTKLSGRGTFELPDHQDTNLRYNNDFKNKFPKLATKYGTVTSRLYQPALQHTEITSRRSKQKGSPPHSAREYRDTLKTYLEEDRTFTEYIKAVSQEMLGPRPPKISSAGSSRSRRAYGGQIISSVALSLPAPSSPGGIGGGRRGVPPALTKESTIPTQTPPTRSPASKAAPLLAVMEYIVGDDVTPNRRLSTSQCHTNTISYHQDDDDFDNKAAGGKLFNPYANAEAANEILTSRDNALSPTQLAPFQDSWGMFPSPTSLLEQASVLMSEEESAALASLQSTNGGRRAVVMSSMEAGDVKDVDIEATLRDWNTEYQQLIEFPCLTPHQAHERADRIQRLQEEFRAVATSVAHVIIQEKHSKRKTFEPSMSAGGVAGGDKYIVGNLFFKFCSTAETEKLYGGFENSMKSATRELQGLNAIVASNVKRLRVPLSMVITFRGQRLWVAARIPVDNHSLVYGSRDAGMTVFAEDVAFGLMKNVAKYLNLKAHYVGRNRTKLTLLYGPVDIEVHQGKDGRMYVIDTARIFPPDPNKHWREQNPASFWLFQHLRAELVAAYDVPLSSDAFSELGNHNRAVLDKDVADASAHLNDHVIPKFVTKIHVKMNLCENMHKYGINFRYLGKVLEVYLAYTEKQRTHIQTTAAQPNNATLTLSPTATNSPSHNINIDLDLSQLTQLPPKAVNAVKQQTVTMIVVEIVARAIKTLFHTYMHNIPSTENGVNTSTYYEAICSLFNGCFSGNTLSSQFHKRELLPVIYRKFNPGPRGRKLMECLCNIHELSPEIAPTYFVSCVNRASVLCGIKWNTSIEKDTTLAQRLGSSLDRSAPIFTQPLISEIIPVIKMSKVSSYANVVQLLKEKRLDEAEYIYLGELHNRERVLGEVPELVPLLEGLAILYSHPSWNKLNELLQIRKRIVKIYQDRKGEEQHSAAYVDALGELGETYLGIFNVLEAEPVLTTALQFGVSSLPMPSGVLAKTYHRMGRLMELVGNENDALRNYDTAAISCGQLSTNNKTYEDILTSRAGLHFDMGNERLALEDATEALQCAKERCKGDGDKHPDVLYKKALVGKVCFRKEPERALELVTPALQIHLEDLPNGKSTLAALMIVKALALKYVGNVEDGYRICEEALSMQQMIAHETTATDPAISKTFLHLTEFLYYPFYEIPFTVGEVPARVTTAKSYLKQSASVLSRVLQGSHTNHPIFARIHVLESDIHRTCKNYPEALAVAKQAVQAYEGNMIFHIKVADAFLTYGRALCATGDHAMAIQQYYRALSVYERSGYASALCIEVLTNCLPHARIRSNPPVVIAQGHQENLFMLVHAVFFSLYHKDMSNAVLNVRVAIGLYKQLFPVGLEWDPDAESYLKMLLTVLKLVGQNALVDDVFSELTKLTEVEKERCTKYQREQTHRRNTFLMEEDQRKHERLLTKLQSVVKQIHVYVAMGKGRNALHVFMYALETFSALWPRGVTTEDAESATTAKQFEELLLAIRALPLQDHDQSFLADVTNYIAAVVEPQAALTASTSFYTSGSGPSFMQRRPQRAMLAGLVSWEAFLGVTPRHVSSKSEAIKEKEEEKVDLVTVAEEQPSQPTVVPLTTTITIDGQTLAQTTVISPELPDPTNIQGLMSELQHQVTDEM
eukprot:PhF_6_TR42980/c0_g1_i2/m.65498